MTKIVDSQVHAVGNGDFPDAELVEQQVEVYDVPVRKTATGAVWFPTSASDLHMRLFVVAHIGVGGHRGINTTKQILVDRFWWSDIASDVSYFVDRCLHGASTGLRWPYKACYHVSGAAKGGGNAFDRRSSLQKR
ncbi:hypothetical protein DYB35_013340 [Aphanomyces astaci]|uniref:Integrase zinc-binding domain-containing protein n=2 Tax=Aphanomyces astaci TaxID=112090 RepID=A0A418DZM4_APHAT|nr:hypothetical protein DYB35_013340 [Aphanomyces astaci]